MKKLFLMVSAMFLLSITGAKAQNNIWSLPPNYVQWVGTVPTEVSLPQQTQGYAGQPAEYSHNAMQDANGDLLFFIVDGIIYDADGYYIDNLNGYLGFTSTTSVTEVVLIPDPVNCNRYYIVTTFQILDVGMWDTRVPYVFLLDMTLQGPYGLGALTLVNGLQPAISLTSLMPSYMTTPLPGIMAFKSDPYRGNYAMAASRLRTVDNDRLFFISDGVYIFKYKIDINGFTYDNVHDGFGDDYITLSAYSLRHLRSEMELYEMSNGNYKIAYPVIGNGLQIYTAEFDSNGVLILGTEHYILLPSSASGSNLPYIHGIEFSPNGEYLYFTHKTDTQYPVGLKVYNITGQYYESIPSPLVGVNNFENSFIELASDGKMYLASHDYLATIDDSDNPGSFIWDGMAKSLTNYNLSSPAVFYSHGKDTYLLPDQIDGMDYSTIWDVNVSVSASSTSICENDENGVTLTATGASTYYWLETGETTASIIVSPTSTTDYNVVGFNGDACFSEATISITVNPAPNFNLGGDIILCSEDPFPNLCPSVFNMGDSYLWTNGPVPVGTTSPCWQTTSTGNYCLEVTNAVGCSATECADVQYDPRVLYDYNFTTHVECSGTSSFFEVDLSFDDQLPAGLQSYFYIYDVSLPVPIFTYSSQNWMSPFVLPNNFLKTKSYVIKRRVYSTDGCVDVWVEKPVGCIAGKGERRSPQTQNENDVVSDNSSENSMTIFPNPTNGVFTLKFEEIEDKAEVVVYNSVGEIVLSKSINNENLIELNIEDQPKGVYFVKVVSENNVMVKQLIKS